MRFLILLDVCNILLTSFAPNDAVAGTRRAFLVAVGEYASPDMPPLKHTNKHVQDLSNLLIKQKTYSREHVWVINDDSGDSFSTRKGIVAHFQNFLRTVSEDDDVFVLLSGHGMRFLDDSTDPRTRRDDYFFCPRISNSRDPDTMISIEKEIEEPLSTHGKRRILLVDACRAIPAQLPQAAPPSKTRPIRASGAETMVLMSCGPQQFSYYDDKGSFFLQSVLRGLEGLADRPNPRVDREVTAAEFSTFVVAETQRLSKGRQHPEPRSKLNSPETWVISQKAEKRLYTQADMTPDFFQDNKELQFAEFRGVNLTGYGKISGVNFQKARFVDGCNLRSVTFYNCRFDQTEFRDSDLSYADFSESSQTHEIILERGVRKFGVRWPSGGKPDGAR
ncbi:MAG: caspase family protein [Pirellulales bacterium]